MNDHNKNENGKAAGGVGFCGLLAIAFIVLKLTHVIEWSWLWVLSPLWIPAAIVAGILVIVVIVAIVKMTAAEVQKRMKD